MADGGAEGPLMFPNHRELERAAVNFIGIVGLAARRLDRDPSDVNSKWFLDQVSSVLEKQTARHDRDDTEELRKLHLHLIYAVSCGRDQE